MKFVKDVIMVILGMGAFGCTGQVKTGLDNISSYKHIFRDKRVGIITNHTAYDRNGRYIIDIFKNMPEATVTAAFGPEHGIKGLEQDAVKVADADESEWKIPVYSLYGKHLKPTKEMLENLDVLVFDIQDIGARFYTYVYTMSYAMEAAAEQGKIFVVLDRPNPINGSVVEGNILDERFSSFVGLYPIALRHGMTAGELATMFNEQGWLKNGVKAELFVVPVKGWKRNMWYDQTGLKFIKPSPNMGSLETAAIYPGMCLFEGTNVSEGRGTDSPFLQFGAPWIDSEKLVNELNGLQLKGLRFEPVSFVPEILKYKGETCNGARIVITDRDRIESFWSGVKVVNKIYQMYTDTLEFKPGHFDRLCGTDKVRKAIVEGKDLTELRASWQKQLDEFLKIRSRYLLYE